MKKYYILFIIGLLTTTVQAQWTQQGLDVDGEVVDDESGSSVAMSNDGLNMIVGAIANDGGGNGSGHARIYAWNGTSWVQQGSDIDGEAAGDQCGSSVAMSYDGSSVAIGSRYNGGAGAFSGHTRVYDWNGTTWVQKGIDIDGEQAGEQSGYSVAMSDDGNTLAIGAPENTDVGVQAGQTRVYEWNGTAWVQKGADLNAEMAYDESGRSIAMNDVGSTIIIGARKNDGGGNNSGHARIYEWNGTAWMQKGIDIDGESTVNQCGFSVAMSEDGNTIAVGAINNGGAGSNSGHTRIHEWNGTAWVQKGTDIDGPGAGYYSGYSVALSNDGSNVAIGAPFDNIFPNSGQARAYWWNGTSWIQKGVVIQGEGAEDFNGFSVAISGDGSMMATGAIYNDGAGPNAGHVRVYECPITYGTDVQIACGTYTWMDGNIYTANNNVATHIIANAMGCDSVITLDLTINPLVNNAVTQISTTLTADETGATYQWLDCPAMTLINGATNQAYTATVNGDYAVIVTNNGCSDTSACLTVASVNLDEMSFGNNISIQPNPTNQNVTLDLGKVYNEVQIQIVNSLGQTISSKEYEMIENVKLELIGARGVYYVTIQSEEGRIVRKVIKK